MYVGWV